MTGNLRGREPRPHRVEVSLSEPENEDLSQACQTLDATANAIMRWALHDFTQGQGLQRRRELIENLSQPQGSYVAPAESE